MNAYELLFIIQFFVYMGVLLIKLYNLMRAGEWYDWKLSFIGIVTFFIMYGVSLVILLSFPEDILYISLFKLQTWLLMLGLVFWIGEIMLNLGLLARKKISRVGFDGKMEAVRR